MVAKLSLTERPARLTTGLVTATVLEGGLVTIVCEAASIMDRLLISEPLKQIKVQKYEFTYKEHLHTLKQYIHLQSTRNIFGSCAFALAFCY
jgi:hypothetical protein